jgi:hypothetical protein
VAKTSVVKFAKRTAQQAPAQLEQCPLVSLGDFVAAAIIVVEALARRTRSRVGRDAEYAARIILRTSNSGSLADVRCNPPRLITTLPELGVNESIVTLIFF